MRGNLSADELVLHVLIWVQVLLSASALLQFIGSHVLVRLAGCHSPVCNGRLVTVEPRQSIDALESAAGKGNDHEASSRDGASRQLGIP